MRIQFTLASRYLVGRKLRTFLTTLAIMLGVTVIFGLNALLPTMMKAFTQAMQASAGEVDLAVTSTSGGTFSPRIAEEVRSTEGVEAATPVLSGKVTFPDGDYDIAGLYVVGLDPRTAGGVRALPIASGRFLTIDDESGVVMSRDTAKTLGLRLSDTLETPAATGVERLKVVGLLSTPALPGADEIFVTLPTAQAMFGGGDRISGVEAVYAQGADRDEVRSALQRRLGDEYSVGGVQTESALFSNVRTGQIALNIFGVFALAIGGFIIFNTFRTAVMERRHDIGMLRSLGASRTTIIGMFVTESLLQGIIGTGLGLLGGYALALAGVRMLSGLVRDYLRISDVGSPVISAGTWAAAILLGVGVALVAGIWPALSASRVTPLEALRPTIGEVYEKATRRRGLIGGALMLVSLAALLSRNAGLAMTGALVLLAGLVLAAPALVRPVSSAFGAVITLAFAREGRVAQSNLVRQPNRSAITASAVMISLAVVVGLLGVITSIFAAFANYLDRSLGSDLLVLPQSLVLGTGNVAAGPGLASALRKVEDVDRVASLRLGVAKMGDKQVQVAGIDPKSYPRITGLDYTEGSDDDLRRLEQGRNAVANGIFAAQNRVGAGDTVGLRTPDGIKEYEVVAVGSDYLNAKIATVYVSQDMLARDFNVTTDIMLLVDAKPGTDLAAVEREANEVVADYPAFKVYEAAGFRESQRSLFRQIMASYYVLLALLAFPSLLALLNTLAINVLARTREIGMLRAVGSTRRQVRRMILAESLLLSAMGTSLGIFAGLFLGYALTAAMNIAGFKAVFALPYSGALTAVAVGLLFGVIASVWPARQAARLEIVRALRYE